MSTSIQSSQQPSQAGVHPSAVGSATDPNATGSTVADQQGGDPRPTPGGDSDASSSDKLDENGYPEQRHAGVVGYGPQYHQGAGFTEKLTGMKEQLKGKISRDPELVQQGKQRYTGELKHKKEEEEDLKSDPFAKPNEKKEEGKPEGKPASASASSKSIPQRDERGQEIQAGTTAPEGTDKAEGQTQKVDELASSQSELSAH